MNIDKLAKAKAGLILDQPFFASILLGMPCIQDDSIKTLATDGESIRYNGAFLESLSQHEVTFVLAHETLHCVFQHMHRRGNKNPNRWNIAADYIINDLLKKENIGAMPKGALHDSALVAKGNGTAEGVYGLLPDETEQKGPGDNGGALDDLQPPSNDPTELTQKESEMKVKVIQAKNAAKMMGKLSAGIDRLVEELTRTETDWRSVLRRFLSERAKIDLSYAKPKRRFLADDVYLPSLIGEKLGAVAVAVDCSGSIDEKQLGEFESEIRAVIQDACPTEVNIIYFDSEVLKRETFGPDSDVKLNPVGGGGTAFSPIFETLNADETQPVAVVVLTDLECGDFGPTPEYPVLWACTKRKYDPVPFGEVTVLKTKGN